MINTKLIFVFVLFTGSACGMEQAKVRLMADYLEKTYAKWSAEPESKGGGNILHFIAQHETIPCEESLIREFIKRGVDLHLKNAAQQTPLFLAAISNKRDACAAFHACGAQDDDDVILLELIPMGTKKNSRDIVNTYDGIKQYFGARWFEEQRKRLLFTTMLCLGRIFPKEIEIKILSYLDHDCIPNSLLGRFFDFARYGWIKDFRKIEAGNLIYRLCKLDPATPK